jgi:nicotinamide mononucleotide (NMN) deamidase PncC
VHLAAAHGNQILHRECHFGDIVRSAVRLKTVEIALQLLRDFL